MPTYMREDRKPVVQFEPALEISPFILFRRLKKGQELHLFDVRPTPGPLSLAGARRWPGQDWEPEDEKPVVLFDHNGNTAIPIVQKLQAAGFEQVRALFGGLELYEFSLDPQVVGSETYLVRSDDPGG